MTPAEDTKDPTATAPVVTALPDGSARVEWKTNEATTGEVSVGRSARKLTISAADSEPARAHSLVVTGLSPDSTYWIRTTSKDGSGNAESSKRIRVNTPAAGVAEQMAASFRRGKSTGKAAVDPAGLGAVTLAGDRSAKREGTFTSGTLDGQAMVDWDRALSRVVVPKGSSMVLKVRTGSTSTPDSSWTSWQTVSSTGRIVGSSRLIQYQVVMTSAAHASAPELLAVGFSGNGDLPVHEGETQ